MFAPPRRLSAVFYTWLYAAISNGTSYSCTSSHYHYYKVLDFNSSCWAPFAQPLHKLPYIPYYWRFNVLKVAVQDIDPCLKLLSEVDNLSYVDLQPARYTYGSFNKYDLMITKISILSANQLGQITDPLPLDYRPNPPPVWTLSTSHLRHFNVSRRTASELSRIADLSEIPYH